MAEVRERGRSRRLRAGEAVHFAGDPASSVCVVLSGLVELTRPDEEGRELVLALIRQGEVFGLLALVGGFFELDTARARIPSRSASSDRRCSAASSAHDPTWRLL